MTDLKKCPFCGGEAQLHTAANAGLAWAYCEACELEMPSSHSDKEAIEFWNTRAVPELPTGYREEKDGARMMLRRRDLNGEYTVANWVTSHNYVSFPGNGMCDSHALALSIWLQRRLANAD